MSEQLGTCEVHKGEHRKDADVFAQPATCVNWQPIAPPVSQVGEREHKLETALHLLLTDIRPVQSDEPLERVIPCHHSVGTIVQARAVFFSNAAQPTPQAPGATTNYPDMYRPFAPPAHGATSAEGSEPYGAKQRVEILERIMRLPYIKATRNTDEGEKRFVCRDDVVTVFHEYAKAQRAALARERERKEKP